VKNPSEDKFKKCKTTNPNFDERVGKIEQGIKILNELGFVQEGEFLICKNLDTNLFDKTISLLETEISKLS